MRPDDCMKPPFKKGYKPDIEELEEELEEADTLEQKTEDVMAHLNDYVTQSNKAEFHGVDNITLVEIIPLVLRLQNIKEKFYGSSWRKRGDIGVFFNVDRKFDRVDNMVTQVLEGKASVDSLLKDKSSEAFFDTVLDMGVYCLLWVSNLAKRNPELYSKLSNDIDMLDN